MSLSPNEKYPGATEADPNYKDSKFKDNNPSTTNNGSPLKALDRNEQLALQEAMMNAAGFDYNGVVDTPQNSQMFNAYKAALSNGANLLSNHNFIIASPDDSQPAPSATPTSYPPGYEIFSGVFANETTGILNLTYIDGRVSFSGGDLYFAVANTGGVERLTAAQLTASVADFDGKPRTRGVSFALVGDEYRVTVGIDALEDVAANPTPLGSVKFEQGSVATGHSVSKILRSLVFGEKWELTQDENFFYIKNIEDGLTVFRWADGVSSGSAHLTTLPIEARRDSHGYILTAGTFGGSTDINARTSEFSDYALLNFQSTYQNEKFQLSYDTKPSRNDGTKKDGTGGGGLSPSDDVYAFDSAMEVPSNSTLKPVSFPSLGVLFNKYIELAARSGSNRNYRFTPSADDVSIAEVVSGNDLGGLYKDHIRIGGTRFYAQGVKDIQAVDGNNELNDSVSVSSNSTETYRLAAPSVFMSGVVRVSCVSSGGAGFGMKHFAFKSDGVSVTESIISFDDLPAQVTAVMTINSGVLDLEVSYTTGLGGSMRVNVDVEWGGRAP